DQADQQPVDDGRLFRPDRFRVHGFRLPLVPRSLPPVRGWAARRKAGRIVGKRAGSCKANEKPRRSRPEGFESAGPEQRRGRNWGVSSPAGAAVSTEFSKKKPGGRGKPVGDCSRVLHGLMLAARDEYRRRVGKGDLLP